jgi:hypothetical protein
MATPYFYLFIDGAWVEATGDGGVYTRDGITISRGYANENSKLKAGTANFTLRNDDLRYVEDNPLSPYFEQFGQNTPCKIMTEQWGSRFGFWIDTGVQGSVSTPDSAALSITGDIDIRVDSPTYEQVDSASTHGFVYKGTSYRFYPNLSGGLSFRWFPTSLIFRNANSTVAIPAGHSAFRVTLDINNGAGGYTVTFYTAANWGDPWVQLGATVSVAVLETIRDTADSLYIGSYSIGPMLVRRVQIYNGIAGSLVANPDFTIQAEGATSFTDSVGVVWTEDTTTVGLTIRSNIGYNRDPAFVRFFGELSDAKYDHNVADTDHFVQVEVSGITRRLQQGDGSPVGTALEAWVPTQTAATFQAVAYWPINEGPGASAAQPSVGNYQLAFVTSSGATQGRFGLGDTRLPWLDRGAQLFTGDVLRAEVDMSGTNAWEFDFVYACEDGADVTFTIWTRHPLGSNAYRVQPPWTIQILPSTSQIGWTDPDGTSHLTATVGWDFDLFDGVGKLVNARFTTNGSSTDVDFVVSSNFQSQNSNGVLALLTDGFSGTATGTTSGEVRRVEIKHAGAASKQFVLNHLMIFGCTGTPSGAQNVRIYAAGNNTERANDRVARLLSEKGVEYEEAGLFNNNSAEPLMGPQYPDDLVSLIDECTAVNMGLLYEPRGWLGYRYIPMTALHNASVMLTLDYSAHEVAPPFKPVRNDQRVINAATVKRRSGGEATFEQTVGRYKVSDPIDGGVGRYEKSATINSRHEVQLAEAAGWLVHLGTWDEARYPTVTVFLSALSDAQAEAALTLDVGDKMRITDAQTLGRYNDIDLLVLGYEESWDEDEHRITFNCVPQRPYRVVKLNDTTNGWAQVDSLATTLTNDITTTQTSFQVTVSDGATWGGFAVQKLITVGGEQMFVTANPVGSTSPQTFVVTRSANGVVKAHAAGTPVRLYHPASLAYARNTGV